MLLLAVARGDAYQIAAHAISQLVTRFNAEVLAALNPRYGGGRTPVYDWAIVGRILGEVERALIPASGRTAS